MSRAGAANHEDSMTPGIDRAAYRAMTANELEDRIRDFNARYWDESDPVISDDDFDYITRLLAEKDPGNRLLDQVNAPAVASTENIRQRRPGNSSRRSYRRYSPHRTVCASWLRFRPSGRPRSSRSRPGSWR